MRITIVFAKKFLGFYIQGCLCLLSISSASGQSIEVSHQSGCYEQAFYVKVNSEYQVRYSIDGTTPILNSKLCSDSIPVGFAFPPMKFSLIPTNRIVSGKNNWKSKEFAWRPPQKEVDKLACIRLLGFEGNRPATEVITLIYRIGTDDLILPIVTLTTDSINLFSDSLGILVPGNNYDIREPDNSGNYYERGLEWERSGHICFFDRDGNVGVSQNVGVRIHGGRTRQWPQKSLRIYARNEYGRDSINYPLFGEEAPSKFKRVILRSAMTHWFSRNTVFQDEFLQNQLSRYYPDIDIQRYQPVFLYINGEFWGLMNLRERQDEYYFADHYGILSSEIEIVEASTEYHVDFTRLIDFCNVNDLKNSDNYQWLTSKIDLINFIHYTLFELFTANLDWPHNNYKVWRSNENNILWRWIVFDLDASLGDAKHKSLETLLESKTPHGILFRSLSQNTDFVNVFLSEWNIMKEKLFSPQKIGESLERVFSEYKDALPLQIERWQNPVNEEVWAGNIDEIIYFLLERPEFFEKELADHFGFQPDQNHSGFEPGNHWKIYPNPVQSLLTVESTTMLQTNWTVEIVNMLGSIIYSKDIGQRGESTINIEHLSEGLYLLRIRSSMYQYSFIVRKE